MNRSILSVLTAVMAIAASEVGKGVGAFIRDVLRG